MLLSKNSCPKMNSERRLQLGGKNYPKIHLIGRLVVFIGAKIINIQLLILQECLSMEQNIFLVRIKYTNNLTFVNEKLIRITMFTRIEQVVSEQEVFLGFFVLLRLSVLRVLGIQDYVVLTIFVGPLIWCLTSHLRT